VGHKVSKERTGKMACKDLKDALGPTELMAYQERLAETARKVCKAYLEKTALLASLDPKVRKARRANAAHEARKAKKESRARKSQKTSFATSSTSISNSAA
jgi:hypothetical protein